MDAKRFFKVFALAGFVVAVTALSAAAQTLAPPPVAPVAPEIDGGTLSGAIAMLVCGALLFFANNRQGAPTSQA